MKKNSRGFTLIEIIIVILLIGIISVFGGLGLIEVMKGYNVYKTGLDLSRKSQLAMSRIVREFSYIESIDSNSSTQNIEYTARYPDSYSVSSPRLISYSGNVINLDGHILIDNVNNFQINYCSYNSSNNEVCQSFPGSNIDHLYVDIQITEEGINKSINTRTSLPKF